MLEHSPLEATRTVTHPFWTVSAALLGLTAVALGAMAAHIVTDAQASRALERAALYQLIHAVVLLYASGRSGSSALFARALLLVGTVLFCGSIEVKYLLSLTAATNLAPIGGVALMIGWMMLGVSALTRVSHQKNQAPD
jgi:uncharacterized membrane protein YgdD (TMEM256/DUF423 family)